MDRPNRELAAADAVPAIPTAGSPPAAPRLRRTLRDRGGKRAALMPYLTAGFPDMATCSAVLEAALHAGADVVELGIPFSDPVADGPVVQASSAAALRNGVTTDDVLELAAGFGGRVPIVLLTYANTVVAYGERRFVRRAADAGVEALVVPDLPVDEAGELAAVAADAGLSLVPMATPTSTDPRLDLVAAAATSFIYCVTVTGVTGARQTLGAELPALVGRLRRRTHAPLVAGFGISTPAQAAQVADLADGVIIGSALIERVAAAVGVAGPQGTRGGPHLGAALGRPGRKAQADGSAQSASTAEAARAAAELLAEIAAALRQPTGETTT